MCRDQSLTPIGLEHIVGIINMLKTIWTNTIYTSFKWVEGELTLGLYGIGATRLAPVPNQKQLYDRIHGVPRIRTTASDNNERRVMVAKHTPRCTLHLNDDGF